MTDFVLLDGDSGDFVRILPVHDGPIIFEFGPFRARLLRLSGAGPCDDAPARKLSGCSGV